MRIYILFVLIALISCKNKSTNIRSNHNVMGCEREMKEDVYIEYNDKHAEFSTEVIKLNEKAMLFVNKGNKADYQEAIKLLDRAIHIDTTYYIAYLNKASILTRLEKYNEAINIFRYVVTLIKPDYPEALSILGLLYDKIGEKSTAEKYYKKAIRKYSDRINEKEDVMDMVNRAHLNYILDREKGLNEMDSLINVYPQNDELLIYKECLFLDYNHQKTLDDL